MSLYTFALFAHVTGAIGVFAGLSAWLFGVALLRRAERVEQVRLIVGMILAVGNLVVASILVLAVAGIYMAVTVWAAARPAWILVATVSFLLLAPFGVLVIDRRVRTIARQARSIPDELLSPALAAATRDPVLDAGLRIYIAILLGIVFLMTTKPHLNRGNSCHWYCARAGCGCLRAVMELFTPQADWCALVYGRTVRRSPALVAVLPGFDMRAAYRQRQPK